MENLSHSRKPNRGSSHATLTTKRTTTCNGATNFSGKTMYDDVFGGTPRFGAGGGGGGGSGPTLSPRPEDYTEIFGGFHASRGASIPVLDLPVVDDNDEVMIDVRNPRFNYAEVFGGFDGLDFAASYEELMRQANGGDDRDRDGDDHSSDEAWMQAETESLSEGSDHSGKYQHFSNGDYCEPVDTSMEFSMSYHKANVGIDRDISNGVMHVGQLHADLEYAYIIETPLQKTDKKNPPLHVTDDIDLEFTKRVTKKKHLRKTVSHTSNWAAGEQMFTTDSTQREYRRNGSCSDEMFVTISDINLRTVPSDVPPPSRPPPFVDVKNRDHQNGQPAVSGERMGDSSSPFFDVEIDASSAAAASAAAMKKAMDKAQVKLKSAKELLERKRDGIKNSTKPGSKSEGKGNKERASKTVDGPCDIKDERVLGMDGKEDSRMKIPVREEGQKAVKSQAADSLEVEKLFNAPKIFIVEKHGKESQSIQELDGIDGADEWQEATQFFELVRTDKSRTGLEPTNNEKVLVQSMKSHELQHKAKKVSIGALEQQLDSDKKVEAVREDHELEKVERDKKTAKESCESTGTSKPVKEARRHKGHEKKVKAAQEISELEENMQSLAAQKPLENGKKPTGADELGKHEKWVNAQQKENKVEIGQAVEQKQNGQQEKQTSKIMENPKTVKEFPKRKDEEKSWREVFEQEKNEANLEEVLVKVENDKKLCEALEQEEKEKRLKEACEGEEYEKKEEANELEESEKIWRMALEQLENEKRLKQAHLQEENEKRQRKALEQEEMEKKQREACEKDESKRRPKQVTEEEKDERQQKEVIERKETENRLKEACEKEAINKGVKEACEKEDTAKRFKETCEKEDIEKMLEEGVEQKDYSVPEKEVQDTEDEVKKGVIEQEEPEESQGVNYVNQLTERCEKGKKLKIADGTHQHVEGEYPVVSDAVNNLDYSKKHEEMVGSNDQNFDELEESEKSILEENGKMEAEFRDSEKKSDAMAKGDFDGKLNASGMASCGLEAKVNQFRKDDVSDLRHQDDSVKKAGEAGISIGQRNAEKINSVPGMDSGNDNQRLKFAYEWRERARNIKEAQFPSHLEEDKDKFLSAQAVKGYVETGRKQEPAKASVLEEEGSIQRTLQQVKISQSTERKDKKVNESLTPEEKEAERLKRERELEKERLRKIEEEREREREREKDRMAIDRAALEAYERGYAEARERVERAAEARQRAMAEARDRLEKACAEAREKSSMETRLRAERAAVERATAEARERAVEKAMAERAASEARERVERSMSDKFSTSSRNNGMRTSSLPSDLKDQHFQSSGSFGGLRYPNSSTSNGVEGESAQRCKARLERYHRTAERAAKALEEKNMRDLLAQREQAERNRLAETLDADVKRWSSGKEGNLRALLSTLQYILGPESGWQPIPLTEVITSAAVKKAYRKATLCVHPDKLQQRGASIHQKYICEKVFDLLKEAWNKFNSEER